MSLTTISLDVGHVVGQGVRSTVQIGLLGVPEALVGAGSEGEGHARGGLSTILKIHRPQDM